MKQYRIKIIEKNNGRKTYVVQKRDYRIYISSTIFSCLFFWLILLFPIGTCIFVIVYRWGEWKSQQKLEINNMNIFNENGETNFVNYEDAEKYVTQLKELDEFEMRRIGQEREEARMNKIKKVSYISK